MADPAVIALASEIGEEAGVLWENLDARAQLYTVIMFGKGTFRFSAYHMDDGIRHLTKLMTAYLVFTAIREKKIALDQQVNVSERAWRMGGSRMFIEPKKPVTVDELIRGMVVQSGNDACVALAEGLAELGLRLCDSPNCGLEPPLED